VSNDDSVSWRLDDGRPWGRRLVDIFDVKNEFKDLTYYIEKIMFKEPTEGDFELFVMTIVGTQGQGKTEFCKGLAYRASQIYGDRVKIIFTDSIDVACAELDEHTIYFVIIDDAVNHQAARESMSKANVATMKKWYDIRHKGKTSSGSETGRLIFVFNYQVWSTVDKTFQNPQMLAALSPLANDKDVRDIQRLIGEQAYECLDDKQQIIESGDNSVKGNAMVRIMSKPVERGVGWFYGTYVPAVAPNWDKWPKYLKKNEYNFSGKLDEEEILDILLSEDKWKRKTEHYILNVRNKGTPRYKMQSEIAAQSDPPITQERVSQNIKEVKAEIERRMTA